jgi:hypothetical protein
MWITVQVAGKCIESRAHRSQLAVQQSRSPQVRHQRSKDGLLGFSERTVPRPAARRDQRPAAAGYQNRPTHTMVVASGSIKLLERKARLHMISRTKIEIGAHQTFRPAPAANPPRVVGDIFVHVQPDVIV